MVGFRSGPKPAVVQPKTASVILRSQPRQGAQACSWVCILPAWWAISFFFTSGVLSVLIGDELYGWDLVISFHTPCMTNAILAHLLSVRACPAELRTKPVAARATPLGLCRCFECFWVTGEENSLPGGFKAPNADTWCRDRKALRAMTRVLAPRHDQACRGTTVSTKEPAKLSCVVTSGTNQ